MIRVCEAGEFVKSGILARKGDAQDVREAVEEILADVEKNGDEALYRLSEKFDGVQLSSLEIPPEEIERAFLETDPELIRIFRAAADNIRTFHAQQVRKGFMLNVGQDIVLGQKVTPLARVGLYVPGGTAAYPSTVLMNAIPAKLAGVGELVMATPPTGGKVNTLILAAARMAGVDRVFQIGGAQAVAALAYGTQSVPRVDKIVGPGNVYVAEAKRQVFGRVAIDMIAGPSEILIIADESADAEFLAADLLSQAEHDKNAMAVLLTTSEPLANAVRERVEAQLETLPRQEIARASIENNGAIVLVESIASAISLANDIAPEHLELCVQNPFDYLDLIRNAGSVFLGKYSPEPLGDYFAGPNHTLPTSGTARFSSPLSVEDFVKRAQYCYYSENALNAAAKDIARFASEEGLDAHARSILVRMRS